MKFSESEIASAARGTRFSIFLSDVAVRLAGPRDRGIHESEEHKKPLIYIDAIAEN